MTSTALVNTEALGSELYNPTLSDQDKVSLQIQQLMTSTVTDADEQANLQEFIDNFNNLSSTNKFVGVIVNPARCNIDDIGTALQDVQTVGGQMVASFPVASGAWQDYLPQLQADTSSINSDLSAVGDHTDKLTSNLPSLTGLAQAAMALDTVMNLLSNPCLGLDKFFGSLMSSGQALFSQISSQITAATNLIKDKISSWANEASSAIQAEVGPLIQNISDMMNVAKQAVSDFTSKVASEVMNFAKAMLSQVRQGLADLLAGLPKDPCLSSLLGSVVTGAAAALL